VNAVSLREMLKKDVRGVALIEFALILPLLLILSLGMIELSYFLLFREKFESSASQMLDIVNQNNNVSAASLDNLYDAFPVMMQPYEMEEDPRILITQIERPPLNPDCRPVAVWQYGTGNSAIAPNIGGIANTGDINLAPGDHLIVMEVFATYTPLINNAFTRTLFANNNMAYTSHYQRTRYGAFKINPNNDQVVTAPCVQ
jgi:Flp pilus assembly protein TadG